MKQVHYKDIIDYFSMDPTVMIVQEDGDWFKYVSVISGHEDAILSGAASGEWERVVIEDIEKGGFNMSHIMNQATAYMNITDTLENEYKITAVCPIREQMTVSIGEKHNHQHTMLYNNAEHLLYSMPSEFLALRSKVLDLGRLVQKIIWK